MTWTIAFIGYGEVGQLFAREFVAKSGAAVSVYDVKCDDPLTREPLARIAAEDRVQLAGSPASAVAGAEVIISAVTADQAVEAAHAAAGHLQPGQFYVDLNSVSPSTKKSVARALGAGLERFPNRLRTSSEGRPPGRPGGRPSAADSNRSEDALADFVEFAVMSPVAGLGIASPILAGGSRAEELAERLNMLGMKIEVVSRDLGVASATKLCRSIVIKGLEAIMVDLNLAGARAGVLASVLKSLTASYPGMDWEAAARTMPTRVARHGVRRAAEMREAARMLEELGLSGAFAAAIADRHETYATEIRKG